jgi:NADH dehydrogenase [ubiquinone] 1 alpha subcomplex assembly factor 1
MIPTLLLSLALSGGQTLYDFGPGDSSRWTTTHDTVMGGNSRGELRKTDAGTLVFEGYVSLENNGGFTSFRSRDRQLPYSGSDGIEMRFRGDGRTYILSFDREGIGLFGGGYWQRFETKKDEWMTVRLPWSQFEPVNFGRKLPDLPALTPETARGLAVYLYDKQDGDFRIEFDSFATYSEGDADDRTDPASKERLALPENCRTLERLIELSGIGEELAQLEGYTLFAPTDEAFQKLPQSQSLMQPEQMEALRAVLLRHVVPTRVDSAAALFLQQAEMADGKVLAISISENELRIGGAKLLKVDYAYGKGIVHTIDRVLLPEQLPAPARLDAETSKADSPKAEIVPGYAVLSSLIEKAELAGALADLGSFTLFAPSDAAFAALPSEALDALLLPRNKAVLQAVLLRHVVAGQVTAFQAIGQNAKPLAGEMLAIRLSKGAEARLTVAGIQITKPDQIVGDAIIHEINAVIVPSDLAQLLAPKGPPLRAYLEDVVAQGIAQYNGGDRAGCAARYRQALEALLLLEQLSEDRAQTVRTALVLAKRQNTSDAAWTLRRAIDLIRIDIDQEV